MSSDATGGGKKHLVDSATESVLEELRGPDVNETPLVAAIAKVQEWNRRLDGE
ncbi:hypothetical protein N0B31_16655 [Salinirubellus salinus]|uniref:Uncharacterized protein n=1 Tax=Salinirubellus salinus TaxID=1364945 RepID=A0A9E7R348_9EURY|nr:hypothetical protein [Salinirubellus salinus]UWM53755.1 hypothetical protein N0B31_16655 [Salinirubellus salinus]